MINLIFFLPTFSYGGAGNSIFRLCKNLNKKKYIINIISIGTCDYKNEFNNFGVKVYELKTKRVSKSIFELNSLVKKIINNKFSKNIFISGIHYANIASIISLRLIKNLKLIVVERTDIQELKIHYSFVQFLKNKLIYILLKIFYKKADLVVANSLKVKNDLQKICNTKVIRITPPSFLGYEKVNKSKKINKSLKILTVGRLSWEKDIQTMIKAMSKIQEKKIILKILGDGSEKENIKNLIKKYKLQKRIFILGHKKIPRRYYLESNLYINASHFEGFPNAIVEAINFNLPVICSDCKGGSNEIILNGKGGDLFNVGDYKDLAKKIISFYKNSYKLNKKLKISRRNIKKFSLENNVNKYESIFKTI
jgi:glycosyltransferase involved in cell wall biosynthesis